MEARGWGWETSTLNSATAATTFPGPEFPGMKPRFLADADFNPKKEPHDDHH